MHDVSTDLGFERKSVADFTMRNMILLPRAWAGFNVPVSLSWQQAKFFTAYARDAGKIRLHGQDRTHILRRLR